MILSLKTKDKTFETETLTVTFGTIEDIINILDLDNLTDKKAIGIAVIKCFKQIKPLLKEIFDGLTDEDIRSAEIHDIAKVFTDIYVYITQELGMVSESTKN